MGAGITENGVLENAKILGVYFLNQESLKKLAAEKAVESIKSGMVVGLGTGSTAIYATKKIGELLKENKLTDIIAIPTSKETEKNAIELGIPLTTLDKHPCIDVTIDGADEVDPQFNLIKGGGGAHSREKIISQATKKQIIVVDESKISDQLGTNWAVPVEILIFANNTEELFLENLGANTEIREDENGNPFITDEGNIIIDANFGKIEDPEKLAAKLNERAGIVEHGLFINLTAEVIVASKEGIKVLKK